LLYRKVSFLLRVKFTALIAALLLASLVSVAQAKPVVTLKLSGLLVEHQTNGAEQLVPVEKAVLKPGDEVRYVIVASNNGTDSARHLISVGRIPAGTVYEAGSASARDGAQAEFSLDGGKTWSPAPTVKVHTPNGDVVKKADPSTFTAVRWLSAKPLPAKSAFTFAYAVELK
jgi:uncharacterized repeat protein (TIGR01451 family)